MQLVIVAGGKGSRLKEITADIPKPMVDVGGKPLLEWQVQLARKHGIEQILMLTGFGAEFIEKYFGDGERWGVNIAYHREPKPLGTAGALLDAFPKLEDVFVVMYGDTMLNVDLKRMTARHSSRFAATLFLHPNDHPQDSDLVEINGDGEVVSLHPYPHQPGQYLPNMVNAALYVFSKKHLATEAERWVAEPTAIDICKHLFPRLLAAGKRLLGYRSREYIKDAGTPERLNKVRSHLATGLIQASSFETPAPTIFLDRDGTLNFDHGWINSPEKLELLPNAAEAIRLINSAGYLAVIITNQPVIARGECTEAQLKLIHNRLEWLLGLEHAYIDAIYYCPHHPDKGFPGERSDLKMKCSCRKPKVGLFQQAAAALEIDTSRSWMIGDSKNDTDAAGEFGIPATLIQHNQISFKDTPEREPALRAQTVLDAVREILSGTAVRNGTHTTTR